MAFCKLQKNDKAKIYKPTNSFIQPSVQTFKQNLLALLSPCDEEAVVLAFPDLPIKSARLMESEDETKTSPTDNSLPLTVAATLLFFRHRNPLWFWEKRNRFILENFIQAHLEFNSHCCINGYHFLLVLIPADTAYSILMFVKVVHPPQSASKYTPEPRVKLSDSLTAACPHAVRDLS